MESETAGPKLDQNNTTPELTKKQSAISALLASSGGNLLKTNERYEVLMRQINTKIEKEGKATDTAQSVSYSKMISLVKANRQSKFKRALRLQF